MRLSRLPRTFAGRLTAKPPQDQDSAASIVHSTAARLTSGVAFYDKLKQIATNTGTGPGLSENCAQLFMKA